MYVGYYLNLRTAETSFQQFYNLALLGSAMILNRNQIQHFGSIPWTVLRNVRSESELTTIFAKSQFDMGKYSLLLTDLCSVWFEELDVMGIKERGKVFLFITNGLFN